MCLESSLTQFCFCPRLEMSFLTNLITLMTRKIKIQVGTHQDFQGTNQKARQKMPSKIHRQKINSNIPLQNQQEQLHQKHLPTVCQILHQSHRQNSNKIPLKKQFLKKCRPSRKLPTKIYQKLFIKSQIFLPHIHPQARRQIRPSRHRNLSNKFHRQKMLWLCKLTFPPRKVRICSKDRLSKNTWSKNCIKKCKHLRPLINPSPLLSQLPEAPKNKLQLPQDRAPLKDQPQASLFPHLLLQSRRL